MNARTVMPSVTLPCHMSLFHSVPPERHGITTNTYIPPVRPINGICEQVKSGKKRSALFYNWEEIRDLARPGRICRGEFFGGRMYGYDRANEYLCEKTAEYLASEDAADFTFLYLDWTDAAGHKFGWMSDGYLDAMKRTVDMIEKLTDSLSAEFVTIITSDLFDPKVCLLFFTITASTLTKPKTPHRAGFEKSISSTAAIFQQWK